MGNLKTFDGVTVEQLSREDYHDLAIDSPELTARREARIASDGDDVTVTLKLGEWRSVIPAVASALQEGAVTLRQFRTMLALAEQNDEMTDDERANLKAAKKALAHDLQVAQVLRHILGELTRQLGNEAADPFFAVDGRMVLNDLDELAGFSEFVVDEAAIASIFDPANVRAELEFFSEQGRKQEAEAASEVTDVLAKFAQDTDSTDSTGKTIN